MNELEKAARKQEIKVCPYEFRCSVSDECYLCQWGGASKQIRGAANESFVLGAEWQAKQSPWISVEERLPDTDNGQSLCNVIIKFDDGSYYIVANIDVEDMAKAGGVTHWMPIPE